MQPCSQGQHEFFWLLQITKIMFYFQFATPCFGNGNLLVLILIVLSARDIYTSDLVASAAKVQHRELYGKGEFSVVLCTRIFRDGPFMKLTVLDDE